MNTLSILITSIIYNLLIIIVYFAKRRLKSTENKLYISLLISNLIGLFLEIASIYTVLNIQTIPVLAHVMTRCYLIYLHIWASLFTVYVFVISFNNKDNIIFKTKYFKLFLIVFIIVGFLVIMLPMYYHSDASGVYSYGPSVTLTFLMGFIYVILWIICLTKNHVKLKEKKYLPIYFYIFMGLIVMAIQAANPSFLLMTSMETFITVLMYFTIENPDLQLLREFSNIKEFAERTNDEKSMFLLNMSQKIKSPIMKIEQLSSSLNNSDDINECHNAGLEIKALTKNLIGNINEVLDVSKIDSTKIKVFNNKYNTKLLFKNVIANVTNSVKRKVSFVINIDDSVPEYLYGDSLALKEVLLTILNNSIRTTISGFIAFSVTSVTKFDVCRLIINIEDSGSGVLSNKLNNLFKDNLETEENNNWVYLKSVLSVINGTIIGSTNKDEGAKYTIVLDQRKALVSPSDVVSRIESIDDTYVKNEDILIVSDNDDISDKISKYLKKYNINIFVADSGEAALKHLRNKEKFKLAFILNNMEKLSGIDTFERIKKIEGINYPSVVLIIKDEDILETKEYQEAGIDDYTSCKITKKEI